MYSLTSPVTSSKVGDTLTATVTPADADVDYQWAMADSALAAESEWTPILGATTDTFTVSKSEIGKFIRVVVSDEDGNEDWAVTTAAVAEDASEDVVIIDAYGLQSDGTGIVSDRLELSYGYSFGTPSAVTWYKDGAVVATAGGNTYANMNNDGGLFLTVTAARGTGTYKAVVVANGQTYETNEIVISKTEDQAVLESFTIEDDYTTGANIDYDATDTQAVATITMNKNFQGTFVLYKKTDKKFSNPIDFLATADNTPTAAAAAVATPGQNSSVLTADAGTNYNVLQKTYYTGPTDFATTTGLGYIAPDGTVTYKFAVGEGLTRGTDYVVVFDQASDSTDDIGGGSENVFEDAVTAPYVTAPTKAAITKATKNAPIEITFYTDDNTVMRFAGKTAAENGIDALGATSASAIYSATTANAKTTAATKKSTTLNNTGSVKQGVWTTANSVDDTNAFWFANIEFGKGIYGADKLTLRTDDADLAQDAASNIEIEYKATAPKDFSVKFSNLRTSGTLYLVALEDSVGTGKATTLATASDESEAAGFARLYNDTTVATASLDVEKGSEKATFEGAITGLNMGEGATGTGITAKAGNDYIAVFLPDDDEHYSPVYTTVSADVRATHTTYKLVGKCEFGTGASYADAAAFDSDNDTAIAAVDQFGNEMASSNVEATTAFDMTLDNPTVAAATTTVMTFMTTPSVFDGSDTGTDPDYPTYSIVTLAVKTGTPNINKGETYTLKLSTGQTVKIAATSADGTAVGSATWKISLS